MAELEKAAFPLHRSLHSISYACNHWTRSFTGKVQTKSKPRMMILSFAQQEMDMLSGVLDTAFGCSQTQKYSTISS